MNDRIEKKKKCNLKVGVIHVSIDSPTETPVVLALCEELLKADISIEK